MSQSANSESLDQLESTLEAAIKDLEETESELSELSEWADEARDRLADMNAHDREAVGQQASELKSELRIIDGPTDLIEFGEQLKESFAKPVERSALQGLEEMIEIVDINLPQDRITELRETVKNRPSSDLQADAEHYQHVISLLEEEPAVTVSLVAAEIETDETRYLVGPSKALVPLIENIRQRRELLEAAEDVFRVAGEWVPEDLTTLSEMERHYTDLSEDVSVEGIEAEVDAIDDKIADIEVPVDMTSIVQSDITARFEEHDLTEYQSELNEVAIKLTTFSTSVQEKLLTIEDVSTLECIPDSFIDSVEDLSKELSDLYANEHRSVRSLLGAAKTVEDDYEQFLVQVMEELKLLDDMYTQISDAEKLADVTAPSIETSPAELDQQAVQADLRTAFQVIIAYREWINTAFKQLSDEFSGEEVGALFERLYTEETVPLSAIDLDALRELQDSVPLVVSLQQ